MRPFAFVTLGLTAAMAFMIGLIVAGSTVPAPALSQPSAAAAPPAPVREAVLPTRQAAGLVNFADVAERINPAVVNIEATTRGSDGNRRRRFQPEPGSPDDPPAGPGVPGVRPQSGSGFVIEPNGEGSHITYEMEFVGPALKGPMAGMLEKQAGAAGKQALEKLVALLD